MKHILILPDGTEISSGVPTGNAIQSITLTQSVNDSQELTLGSTCTNMLQVNLITPDGGLTIAAGEELHLYAQENMGRRLLGIFKTEKPTQPTAHTMTITAYDRIVKLDKDLSGWLLTLTGWPYRLYDFAALVSEACGLELVNTSLPNGDYPVRQFSAQGITGRKLMQWVGQIAGRFCRATPEGKLEFAWYAPSGVTISPGGEIFYYENTLMLEDYQTYPIEKVQLRLTEDEVGAVWPDEAGEKNTYVITGNYLLTADSTDTLVPVARTLYEQLKDVSYTPCTVAIPENTALLPGYTVDITDRNGRTLTAYIMTKTHKDQRDTLQCTGSYRRDSSAVFNNQVYKPIEGKTLELRQKMEGYSIRASSLESQWNAAQKTMQTIRESVAQLSVEADAIRQSVNDTQRQTQETTQAQQRTDNRLSTLEQTARQVDLQLQKVVDNGVDRVITSTGFIFDETGLQVDKSDSSTKTQVTPDGMKVYSKSGGNTEVLSATSDGVDATNLHAKTYLIIGGRSRFENYGSGRTGCFWIGG